jgi:hypothetical protein
VAIQMQTPADPPSPIGERLLYVDISANAPALLHELQGTMLTTALAELTAELLVQARPDRVICPLFGAGLDAYSVIERLEALGYAGEIAVLCPPLPRPRLVEAELRAQGPGQRLTLLMLD